jgi:hypothetical protein
MIEHKLSGKARKTVHTDLVMQSDIKLVSDTKDWKIDMDKDMVSSKSSSTKVQQLML